MSGSAIRTSGLCHSLSPEILEPIRRQGRIAGRASDRARLRSQRPYLTRFRTAFHSQSKLAKVPANSSPVNCPQSGRKPTVAPTAPSAATVPLILGVSRSNRAWPDTSRPLTVNLTAACLHRAPVDVAVPVHSPSYEPAAPTLLNSGRNSKKAAAKTISRPFMTEPPCCTSFYGGIMPCLPPKRNPLDLKSHDRPTWIAHRLSKRGRHLNLAQGADDRRMCNTVRLRQGLEGFASRATP